MSEKEKSYVNPDAIPHTQFLGDDIYVEFDGYNLKLMTWDSDENVTNTINLKPETYKYLTSYVSGLRKF